MAAKNTYVCAPQASASPASKPRGLGSQYDLIEMIGEGGMGAVWRAHDRMLGVDVAIKVIPPDAENETSAGRLVAEARASARVRHPSAVRVLRSGISEVGSPFIVMEILNGEPLDAMLGDRGQITPRDACSLLLPIISAVEVAHEHGIVHRDIKPSNIFLHRESSTRLRPKLLDFGIAKQTMDVNTSMTIPGAILGTPNYMAPEQAYGRADVDHRADVWGLCAVLYELVSNRPPFDGDNYNQVISAVLCVEPERPEGVDDWLWSIIDRGLEKEREDRWISARELGRQIAGWLLREGVENDITNTAIRSGSMRPDAMPAAPPPRLQSPSITGTMTLPPAPRLPSFKPSARMSVAVPAIGLAVGVAIALAWLAAPGMAQFAAVPRQAAAGHVMVAATTPTPPLVSASASATPPAAKEKPKKKARPKRARAVRTKRRPQEPAPTRTGPGRHGMPIPTKARF